VIDYTIYYDQSIGNYVLLLAGVTDQFYLTTFALTTGSTYSFKVRARNSVGFSVDSAALSVLVAEKPAAEAFILESLTAEQSATSALLVWNDANYDGGSPVIDYTISYAIVPNSDE
jgi:hypothetical protein